MRDERHDGAVVEKQVGRDVDAETPAQPAAEMRQADRIETEIGEVRGIAQALAGKLQQGFDAGPDAGMQPALERIGCVMVGRILQRSTHGFVFLVMKAGGYRAGLLVLARRAQACEEALDAGAIARQHQTLRGARGQRAL
ncbi:hypothetical protein C6V06_17425, partial [Burkholderia gladioli]